MGEGPQWAVGDRLIGWLACQMGGWLAGWLHVRLAGRPANWMQNLTRTIGSEKRIEQWDRQNESKQMVRQFGPKNWIKTHGLTNWIKTLNPILIHE